MQRFLPLLFALFVALAGCSALTGPASPTATDTPTPAGTPTATSTPVASPTPTPTPTPTGARDLAPGVTDAGVVNPVALLSAHQRALLDGGFVVNQTVESTYNGSFSNRLVVVTTSGPGGEVAYRNGTSLSLDYEGNPATIVNGVWLNTTAQVSRHVEAGTTTYDVSERLYPPEYLVWFGAVQRDVQFMADDYAVTGVETRDGVRYVTLSATVDRVGNDGVTDTTSTLVVDETGVVRHAVVTATYDEGTTYRTTYDVVRLGVAPPARPAWLDAVPPSAALDVGLDVFEFDATSVELVHLHGDAVPAGSVVTLVSNGTLHEATLDAPFGDGRRYLWLDRDGDLRATATRPAPDDARPLDTEVTVTVRAPDGGELFSTGIGRR